VRKRISIAILLVAGCGGAITQPNVPCIPIVKHDTVRIVKVDTVNIGRIDTVKLTDTIGVYRDVLKIDYWRDTIYVRCDTEFYHIYGTDTTVTLYTHAELDSLKSGSFQ
jgi:hypothetical protein